MQPTRGVPVPASWQQVLGTWGPWGKCPALNTPEDMTTLKTEVGGRTQPFRLLLSAFRIGLEPGWTQGRWPHRAESVKARGESGHCPAEAILFFIFDLDAQIRKDIFQLEDLSTDLEAQSLSYSNMFI